jgi:hypothetical protein
MAVEKLDRREEPARAAGAAGAVRVQLRREFRL